MKRTDEDVQISGNLDFALRQGEFQYVPLVETSRGTGYAKWYARLLTTLVLTLEDQQIVYAQTDYVPDEADARILLVTAKSVVIIDIDELHGDRPTVVTRVVGRKSLSGLEVAASMPIDQEGTAAYGWPGQVEITARYTNLDEPLLYSSTGYARGDTNTRGPILTLLAELQEDLNH